MSRQICLKAINTHEGLFNFFGLTKSNKLFVACTIQDA